MTSNRQLSLGPECANQCGPALHGFDSARGVAFNFGDRLQTQIAEFALFGITEQILDRIELRRIARQPLERDVPVQGFDVFTHHAAAMRRQAIPDDQQLAPDRGGECFQELNQLRALDRAVEETKVNAPETRPGDQRQLLPVEAVLQGRGAALGRPGLDPRGTLAQPRFVDEDDGSSLASGVFFSAGQRLVFQLRIASSSRCSARPVGRWLEKPSSRTMRHTCTVLNEWPNSRLISLPMRANVHTSVGKPLLSAPATNILLSFSRSPATMDPGRPSARRCHARGFSQSMRAQVDTVCRLTVHLRATSACTTPRASMRIPCRRRASSALRSRLYRFVAMRIPRSWPTSINAHHSESVVINLRNSQ